MKYQNLIKLNIVMLIVLSFNSFKANSQTVQKDSGSIVGAIITSGSDATGDFGSVSYSIGQVFYTYVGESSVYNLAQGIQHQEKLKNGTESEIFIFPNPTSDIVNLNMKDVLVQNGQQSYQIYNMQGRLLEQSIIVEATTPISLNLLSEATYILQISDNTKVLKTFKIIKI